MRPLLVILVLSPALCTQTFAGFECQAPGVSFGATPDCEGWTSAGGSARVVPDGTTITGPCALPLDGSAQWAEVSPPGAPSSLGPAMPTVPPSTPGIWPFQAGTVAEIRTTTTVPAFPSGMTDLAVDWYWTTGEGANGSTGAGAPCPCDDFAQIVLVDTATNNVIVTLLYVDTYSPFIGAGNTCPSSITGGVAQNTFGNTPGMAETAQVSIPSSFIGSQVLISVVSANQGDGTIPSPLFVDNFRWLDPAVAFTYSASTSGGGTGDVTLNVQNIPAAATNVLLLASATPAPGGLGTGSVFGLVPDGIFFATLTVPSTPGFVLHFPVTGNPFAGGPVSLPPGTVQAAGQTWESSVLAYNLTAGLVQQSNFQQTVW